MRKKKAKTRKRSVKSLESWGAFTRGGYWMVYPPCVPIAMVNLDFNPESIYRVKITWEEKPKC